MPAHRQPFVIFGTVRTGSYYLVHLLDSAPDITCFGEIYKRQLVELPEPLLDSLGLGPKEVEARNERGARLVKELQALHPDSMVGFKVFPNHIKSAPFLWRMIKNGRFKVVILTRSILEIYVSLEQANLTGTFIVRDGERLVEQPPMTATEEGLTASLGFIGAFRNMAKEVRHNDKVRHFDISYPQLTDIGHRARLLDFLGSGADPATLTSSTLRQSSRPLHEKVSNWDWLVGELARIERTDLLEEAGYGTDGALI